MSMSSVFASTSGGTEALTSVRDIAHKIRAKCSRFFLNTLVNLGAFPIRHEPFLCFHMSPLPCLSPSFFLGLVQPLAPYTNGGNAQISVELLYRVKESFVVGR